MLTVVEIIVGDKMYLDSGGFVFDMMSGRSRGVSAEVCAVCHFGIQTTPLGLVGSSDISLICNWLGFTYIT